MRIVAVRKVSVDMTLIKIGNGVSTSWYVNVNIMYISVHMGVYVGGCSV